MTGVKTSIWLKPESHERWKATGLSLADVVDRGLDAGEPDPLEDKIERVTRRVVREELERMAGMR
jgi:hypothetical protein